ncbi:glycosyltransferase family 2 protein [Streptacidiphilus sp. PAMC 29251]
MISAIAVIVPARDEQRLIGDCLDSIGRAAQHPVVLALPVTVVVAADSCRDRTVPAGRRHGAQVLEVECRSAGAARALGTAYALDLVRADQPALAAEQVWLAHTDADTQVPESWLADQLAHATAGAHAVAGLVQVRDWSEHTATTAVRFLHHYDRRAQAALGSPDVPRRSGRSHPHVHGANLGVRADAYQAVGGFPAVAVGEDHALVTALELAHYRVHASADAPVTTSARRDPRAPGGFGHFLLDLETRTTQPQD